MISLKQKVKDVFAKTSFQMQGRDKGIHVLTYHGLIEKRSSPRLQRNFHTVDEFVTQIRAIKKSRAKVFTPQEFETEDVSNFMQKHKKAFLLTFDDGYRNNIKAMEILEDFGFRAAYFVTTDSIDSAYSIWTVNLSLLMLEGNLTTVDFEGRKYAIGTIEARNAAFNLIRAELKSVDGKQREDMFSNLMIQFPEGDLKELMAKHPYFVMLSSAEINQAAKAGQFFQSHGAKHELLHRHQTSGIVTSELSDSKYCLERITGMPVTWFAYPNGDDMQPNLGTLMAESGYKMGFSLGLRSVKPSDFSFFIPRYDARKNEVNLLC
jgi:peptidoglycan/xylan/chitin deacetylase (PgdA/CDA1 family)